METTLESGKRKWRVSNLATRIALAAGSVRALVGSAILSLLLVVIALLGSAVFGKGVATNLLIQVVLVVGVGIFMGNSGISSFGAHAGFAGIAAYISGLLTMPPDAKSTTLPDLPLWLMRVELPFVLAMVITLVVVGLVALVFGIVIARLPEYSAAIATLGVLVILHVILLGADDFTRGSQTFIGVPAITTLPIALVFAVLAITVARLFRESKMGLQLRASREDQLAASAFSANVLQLRLIAWVVSAMVAAVAGALTGHFITAFSPRGFYFALTFDYLIMLIIGGGATVVGPVGGTIFVVFLREVLRGIENGFTVGTFEFPAFFGLTRIVLALLMLGIMYFRRDGLFGHRELDEALYIRLGKTQPLQSDE